MQHKGNSSDVNSALLHDFWLLTFIRSVENVENIFKNIFPCVLQFEIPPPVSLFDLKYSSHGSDDVAQNTFHMNRIWKTRR